MKRYGDPLFTTNQHGEGNTPIERFWSRVAVTANPDKCWLWTTSVNEAGYGMVTVGGEKWLAHRYAYFITNHTRPRLHVLHHCDTPACVNPKHLYEGTDQDNANDKLARGRQNKGERNGQANRCDADIRKILHLLANEVRVCEVGRLTDTDHRIVSRIKNRKIWKHITL